MITDDEFIEILILNMLGLDDEIFKDLCMLLSAEFLGSYVIMIYTHTYTHTYVEEKQSTPYLLGFFILKISSHLINKNSKIHTYACAYLTP